MGFLSLSSLCTGMGQFPEKVPQQWNPVRENSHLEFITKVTLQQMFGTCSQFPEKGIHSMELGIYWGLLFKSFSKSANSLWQEILGTHPNPHSSLYSGYTVGLHFPASFVARYGHVLEFYLKLICPPFRFGPCKHPINSLFFSPSGWLEGGDA